MMPHDPSTPNGAENIPSRESHSNTVRAAKQADLVSRIMLARRTGDKVSERLLSAELLVSVRPVIKKVVKLAQRHAGSQSPEDLEQTAAIAVLRTVEKYDPLRGGQSFGEVAFFRARTACEQFGRMHGNDIHPSDGAHKGRTAGGTPANAIRVESTDAPAPANDAKPRRSRLSDEVEVALQVLAGEGSESNSPELRLLAAERRGLVINAVRYLAPDRRELVCRVYGINRPAQSVRSVAEAWGAPKSRVDRLLVKALADLREQLVELSS